MSPLVFIFLGGWARGTFFSGIKYQGLTPSPPDGGRIGRGQEFLSICIVGFALLDELTVSDFYIIGFVFVLRLF
jgi:hypothetical protein